MRVRVRAGVCARVRVRVRVKARVRVELGGVGVVHGLYPPYISTQVRVEPRGTASCNATLLVGYTSSITLAAVCIYPRETSDGAPTALAVRSPPPSP